MKMFSERVYVLVAILFITDVQCNGYYGGDDVKQPPSISANSNSHISSLPEYESASSSGDDSLWFLKNNPFQKPPNHPGVERGDGQLTPSQQSGVLATQKPYNHPSYNNPSSGPCGGQLNCNTGPPNLQSGANYNQNSGAYSNQPSGRPQTGQAGGWSSPNQDPIPQENPDCLLRNKADCHAVPFSNVVNDGVKHQPNSGYTGYTDGASVSQNLNSPITVPVPETAYRPPKFSDPYAGQPHGPTPPPLTFQANRPVQQTSGNFQSGVPSITGINPKPIDSNYQQSKATFGIPSSGQYDPKPYTNFNTKYENKQPPIQSSRPAPDGANRPLINPYSPSFYQPTKLDSTAQNSGQGIAPSPGNNNFEIQPPYPGCPAAMVCVPENYCNADGVSMEKPIALSPAQKLYRVALMACSFPTTGEVGVCCRDPNYKDPWPDMGTGHQHHPKDSSGSHGHNDGQYRPDHNDGQYNPGQFQNDGIPDSPSQLTQGTQNVPVTHQGGGNSAADCKPRLPSY